VFGDAGEGRRLSSLRDLPLPLREQLEALGLNRTLSQLIESEQRFRDLFEQGPVAYHELDREASSAGSTRLNATFWGGRGRHAGQIHLRLRFARPAIESREAYQRKLSGQQALVPFPRVTFAATVAA